MSSVISFEDVNVHELASTVTTLPPEEAHHVLQALTAQAPADGTQNAAHDAVDAWLHAAEAALQPGQTDISRGRLLMHEASRSESVVDEPQQPPAPAPESRIGTPSALLFVAVSTITMVLLLLFFGMARSKCTGAGLCSAPRKPAAACHTPHPDISPWSTFVQVQWALSNLTHIAASLGAVANALAPSIMHVQSLGATDIIYAGAEATALTMWDGRAVALLCSALVAAAAVHHILTTLIARIAFSTGAKPRRQLTTPTQRKRTPASKRETPPQTPPRGSTACCKAEVQHAGTQTPPPKTVVLPEARGSRRSARIMVKQMAQAQQQLV
jgi:hypothetical protein